MARAAFSSVIFGAMLAASLFGPAGHLRWPMAWAFLVFYAVFAGVGTLTLDPALLAERTRFQTDVRGWDLGLATAAFALMLPGTLVVCGYDARFGWSPPIPPLAQWLALATYAVGYSFSLWAAYSNPFFSTVVRIQRERGHHVIEAGPYAFVRHPGYAGPIVGHLALPIALGSLWGLVPTVAGTAFLILRTAYEDRTLAQELPGYREYMLRVPWRLCRHVW
jgi:protein-S-isoprenylcysteine O-methyltransferase Ste14